MDEEPLLRDTGEGFTVTLRGRRIYPESLPVESACRRVRAFLPEPNTLVFVPSVGLGYGLKELLDRLPPSSAVLCVERERGLMALALRQGLPDDGRLSIVRAEEPGTAVSALRRLGTHRFRRVREVRLCGGAQLAASFYSEVRECLEREIATHWRNRMTLMHMGSLWVRNLFDNLAEAAACPSLEGLRIASPIWVAGAGPSLDAGMTLLRRARPKVVLMAADTALPALMAQGLEPDFVVALESQHANLADFIPRGTSRTMLLCDATSHPSVTRLFAGRLRFFSSAFADLPLFDRMAAAGLLPKRIPPLGSVGVAAVMLALELGSGDVLLSGLDFSHATDRTHARGTPPHLSGLARCRRTAPMGHAMALSSLSRDGLFRPGKQGGLTRTDPVLLSYRDQLERIVSGVVRVRDCAGEGLPLGASLLSPREAEGRLAGYADIADRPWLERVEEPAAEPGRARGFLAAELRLLREAAEAVDHALGAHGSALEPRDEEALAAVDYAFLHFPDFDDFPACGKSFLARTGNAVNAYAARLSRLASGWGAPG